jgi:YtkA-like
MPVGPLARRKTPALRGAATVVTVVLAVASLSLLACGRGSGGTGGSDLDFSSTLEPAAATVGPATLTVRLRDTGRAVTGAAVRLEAHMSHPGMAPVLADATERTPGVYELSFHFTMPGDWVLLVSASLSNGRRVERRVDVPGVRPGGQSSHDR